MLLGFKQKIRYQEMLKMTYINSDKFADVLSFICNQKDEPFKLEEVAKANGLSLSSLKRLFLEATDQSAGSFIRKIRMEMAFRSLKNNEDSVLGVALSAGFEDHSAFTRAFKKTFGFAPRFSRESINIVQELEHVKLQMPEIVEIDAIEIQCFTNQGNYWEAAVGAWGLLKEALARNEMLDDDFAGVYIGIGHDNPHEGEVAQDKVRFTAGVALASRPLGIETRTIPKGKYAKFQFVGKPNNLGLAYHYIFGHSEECVIAIDQEQAPFIMFDGFPDGFKEQGMLIYVPLKDK
jgi:AraC family transcriptional regulator